MHPPEPIELTGLDGGNPLGFIAAIGLLRVLVEARPVDGVRPRLRWRLAGTWRPVIDAGMDRDAVIDAVPGSITAAHPRRFEACTAYDHMAEMFRRSYGYAPKVTL